MDKAEKIKRQRALAQYQLKYKTIPVSLIGRTPEEGDEIARLIVEAVEEGRPMRDEDVERLSVKPKDGEYKF